jgi:hypothetical protein
VNVLQLGVLMSAQMGHRSTVSFALEFQTEALAPGLLRVFVASW